jgi:hypothetical protein
VFEREDVVDIWQHEHRVMTEGGHEALADDPGAAGVWRSVYEVKRHSSVWSQDMVGCGAPD